GATRHLIGEASPISYTRQEALILSAEEASQSAGPRVLDFDLNELPPMEENEGGAFYAFSGGTAEIYFFPVGFSPKIDRIRQQKHWFQQEAGLDNNIKEESGSKHTTDRSKNRNKLDQEIESESLLVAPRESKCSTCHKVFPTLQALGGHRSSHSYKNNLQAMDSALELIELDWNVMAFVHMHCLLKQSIRIRTSTGGWFLWPSFCVPYKSYFCTFRICWI
ncbi:hypothetical protein CK203_040408, partial [Vitis vinifera]